MHISSRGRYGLRAMLELTLRYGEGPIPLNEIAEEQEISLKYLEQLIVPLKLAGFVRSIRGSHGGYQLTKPPGEIKLDEIVRVLEGPMTPVECLKDPGICDRFETCASRDIWREIGKAIDEVLHSRTLKDLAKRQKEKIERVKVDG